MMNSVLVWTDSCLINLMVISGLKKSIKEKTTTSDRNESWPVFWGETPQPWRFSGGTQVGFGNHRKKVFLVKEKEDSGRKDKLGRMLV